MRRAVKPAIPPYSIPLLPHSVPRDFPQLPPSVYAHVAPSIGTGEHSTTTFNLYPGRSLAFLFLLLATVKSSFAQTASYGPHVWEKPLDPASFEKRINEQLDMAQASIDQLLSIKGARTVENTLAPYDNAVQCLDTAGYQSSAMQIVSPDSAVRDRAQAMVQKVSAVATALALNQALYHAMAALDISKADKATQYYVQRTLLEFRLAGRGQRRRHPRPR